MNNDQKATLVFYGGIIVIAIIAIAALGGVMLGYQSYKVYSKEMSGKASLAEAEWSKKIQIADAQGKLEAAEYNKQTAILEAEAISESNMIIDESLTPEYLTYLFIKGINDGSTETIYIPTEGSLPIIEASRGLSVAAAEA